MDYSNDYTPQTIPAVISNRNLTSIAAHDKMKSIRMANKAKEFSKGKLMLADSCKSFAKAANLVY